ncbi:MAG: flagellar hook-associated protein 1 FlgK [Paracoccaceae bacterium]
MAGLFDIGSSGIAAYRKALNVTGQNIANLNTDGYRRRDVSMTEIAGAQGDITSVADQAGLGVRTDKVNRAFDSYVAARARDTQSDFYEIEALHTSLVALEDAVVPQDYDLTYYLSEFFSALSGIGQAPGDLAPRVAALEQAASLAVGFSETSNTLEGLRQAILGEAEQVTAEINNNLKAMQTMQAQLLSSGSGGSVPNSLLDERERLVLSISDLTGIVVDYGERGDVKVTLGEMIGGPKLIDGLKAGQMSLKADGSRVNVLAGPVSKQIPTQQLTSGRLSGLLEAYEAVSLTMTSLDVMAQKVVSELNAVHANGLSLDGNRGQALFSLSAANVIPDGNNLGSISTTLDNSKIDAAKEVNLRLVFDANSNLWRGYDQSGNVQATGSKLIQISGISVSIEGEPADGDQLFLNSSNGKAANMQFLLTRAQDFAAAGLTLASSSSANLGNAELTATIVAPVGDTTLRPINALLVNSASALSSTRLLNEGAITSIPPSATAVDIFSLTRQNNLSFALTDKQVSQAADLKIQLIGGEKTFSLSLYTNMVSQDVSSDMGDLAKLLNSGAILSGGKTLQDYGLYAAGDEGNLTVSSSYPYGSSHTDALNNASTSQIVSGAGNSAATFLQGNDEASKIQIFTREGRQIAGTPLSQTEVVKLLTMQNGFVDGAEYRADYLNGVDGEGYLGIGVQRKTSAGDYKLVLNGSGFSPSVIGGSADDPDMAILSATQKSTLVLQIGSNASDTIEIPKGVQAGHISELINAQSADTGVTASAYSRVLLSGIPDGTVSFSLPNSSQVGQKITAVVQSSSLVALRDAINSKTSQTSVAASLSTDGKRLILKQLDGNDIVLNTIRSQGGTFSAQIVDEASTFDASSSNGSVVLGSAGTQTAARFSGNVALQAAAGFTVSGLSGVSVSAASSAFANGLISRDVDATGYSQSLQFGIVEGIDTNEASPSGIGASAASAKYSLTLGGSSGLAGTITSADLEEVTSTSVAVALAAKIRATTPIATLKGQAVATLPDKDATISISLGGQSYQIAVAQKFVSYNSDGDADGISAAAAVGNNAALTINGNSAAGSPAAVTNLSPRQVTILSSGNDAGISFTIVGTDVNNNALTETVTGANKGTSISSGYFKTITGITAVGDPAANVSAGISLSSQEVELSISGPEAGRLSAKFDANRALVITTKGGIETGQNIVIDAQNSVAQAVAFGLSSTIKTEVIGESFDPNSIVGTNTDFTKDFSVEVAGTSYTARVAGTYSSGWTYVGSFPSGTPSGVAVSVDASGAQPRILVTQTTSVGVSARQNQTLRVNQSAEATGMGLSTIGAQILVSGQGMSVTSVDGLAVQSDGSASSLAGERITLTNLPGEELIVIMSGDTGARRITANYDIAAATASPLPLRSLEVQMKDPSSRRVEIIDALSGQSIATRTLGSGTQFSGAGYQFILNGAAQTNDVFFVTAAEASAGDGRNLESMMKLQTHDAASGKGGFHDVFRSMITQVGSKLRASEIAEASASSLRDAAAEIDAEFSGVDLDTEAARLLEQQQAYQALARVLSTARELLNTLLDSI